MSYWPDPGDLYGSAPDGFEEWCEENGFDPEDGDAVDEYERQLIEDAADHRAADLLDERERGW